MLEAQSLRTQAGVKIKKKSRSMFSCLIVDNSKGTSMSNWNGKDEPKCQRKYL